MLYDSLIHTYLCDFFAEEVKHGCRPIINNVWFSGKASPVQCRGGHCLGMGVKVGAQKIHNPKKCVEGSVEILILRICWKLCHYCPAVLLALSVEIENCLQKNTNNNRNGGV